MAKDSISIGIIGTGFARTTQIPGFRACEGARVVAIASGHRENAERVAREFGIEAAAGDWREVVGREDVDLVSIVTPPSTHAEMALAALDAAKAVLCEKPLAMDASETDAMRVRARESGLFAHVDHELRFLPARRLMREMIASGEIGRVHHAKFLYRADARASTQRAWDWWSDRAAGGGVLGAIGSHAIDTLHWMLGAQVSNVSASLATHFAERPNPSGAGVKEVTSDDEAVMLLRFADRGVVSGATGLVSLSVVEMGRSEHVLEVFGSEGALRASGVGGLWHSRVGEGDWRRIETLEAPLADDLRDNEWSRGFTVFAREIVRALREGRNMVEGAATFDDGHRTQLVLDAARESHETGRRVLIPEETMSAER